MLLPYAVDASDLVSTMAPQQLKSAFRESLAEIRKTWDDQFKRRRSKDELKKVDN